MEQILFFDIGNTNIKLAVADKNGFVTFSLPTHLQKTSDALGLQLLNICQFLKLETQKVSAFVVSSVVPYIDGLLKSACRRFFSCPIYFVPTDISLALENHYANPQEVGADRLITAFAARRLFSNQNIIVIDFGTATTIEYVQDNAYLGGFICPGLHSSLEALGTKTAKLPHISLEPENTDFHFGQNTIQSINLGMIYGFAAMISGLINKIRETTGTAFVVATGGHAQKIAAVCQEIDTVQKDLLFYGLQKAWQERQTAS